MKRLNQFQLGILYAAGILNELYDEPGIAAGIIREAGLSDINVSVMDGHDKSNLRSICEQEKLGLKGL